MATWQRVRGDCIDWVVEQLTAARSTTADPVVVILPTSRHAQALRQRVCIDNGHPSLLTAVCLTQLGAWLQELQALAGQVPIAGSEAISKTLTLMQQHSEILSAAAPVIALVAGPELAGQRALFDAFPNVMVGALDPPPVDVEPSSTSCDADVEAAAIWLSQQVAAGVPIDQIAFLTADVDAYASALSDRLRRLPGGEQIGVYVAGGIRLATTPGGQRLQTLLKALGAGLSARTMIHLLPALKRGPGDDPTGPPRLSPARAAAVIYGAGISGGAAGDSDGVRQWMPRLRRRRAALLGVVEASGAAEAHRTATIHRQQAERWLRDVEPILPAIQALQDLGERVIDGAAIADIWSGVVDFSRRWMRLPNDPPHLFSRLEEHVQPLLASASAGVDAVSALRDALLAARFSPTQFGMPKAFLGTADSSTGLRFRSVRSLPADKSSRDAAEYARRRPLTPRSVVLYACRRDGEALAVPSSWLGDGPTAIDRIRALATLRASNEWTAMDGNLGASREFLPPLGLSPRRPLSASAIGLLLSCPFRFLHERVLRLAPQAPVPATNAIDPIVYGALFHAVADRFLREAGGPLCRREGDVETWVERASAVAREELQSLRDVYPLRLPADVQRETERLCGQVEALVRDEWGRPPRQLVASEMAFGEPGAIAIAVEGGVIHLRGSIDRLDRFDDESLSLRDLKTGRLNDLATEPLNPGRDLQIGVYTLVLESLECGPLREAGYVSPSRLGSVRRMFLATALDELRGRTRKWLGVARALLEQGMFPRTPQPRDCYRCPFRTACGSGAQQQSAVKLAALPLAHPARAFFEFKFPATESGSDAAGEGR
ncbi:MAG: PD-(D/E)XK nuclease family protein [Deltaproteobacteria bacterium]|nr:PD-(D/E)XK nuclease family protein [Deltaproteobacteria bacterium]